MTQVKKILLTILLICFLGQGVSATDTGMFVDISDPSPIADRTIPINATTNPIAFTVSDSDGGPLIVQCASDNPTLVPNTDSHIIIDAKGRHITVDAAKNEKKHLSARIIPALDQSGTVNLTFKVIDSGGLFATKSMSLTVSTQSTNPILGPYAYVPSYMKTMIKKWLYSTEALPFMTVSVIGNGQIRMGDKVFDSFQKVMISENQNIQVQAQPDEKWQFAYWTGDIVDTQNPLQIKAYDHLDVQAVFISPQDQETQYMKGWELNLWLADKQSPEIPVAEIQLGFSETPEQGRCTTINPKLFIVSETHANAICNEKISNPGENFRHIRITTDSPQTLYWRYEQQGSGSFELIDALTYEVFIADMTTVQKWDIPELGTMDVIIHYTP